MSTKFACHYDCCRYSIIILFLSLNAGKSDVHFELTSNTPEIVSAPEKVIPQSLDSSAEGSKTDASDEIKASQPPEKEISFEFQSTQEVNKTEISDIRLKHTPDLVMDLPFVSLTESSPKHEASPIGGPESPDMSTVADRFAKQNQCTLKKNTRAHNSKSESLESDNSDSKSLQENPQPKENLPSDSAKKAVRGVKPELMAKPQILKKPVFSPVAMKKDS